MTTQPGFWNVTTMEHGQRFEPALPHFNGAGYDYRRDQERLSGQYRDIFNLMRDGEWRTLPEIEALTGHGQASISAQLRHMRKPRFGSHTVERAHVKNGLHRYRLLVNAGVAEGLAAGPDEEAPARGQPSGLPRTETEGGQRIGSKQEEAM